MQPHAYYARCAWGDISRNHDGLAKAGLGGQAPALRDTFSFVAWRDYSPPRLDSGPVSGYWACFRRNHHGPAKAA